MTPPPQLNQIKTVSSTLRFYLKPIWYKGASTKTKVWVVVAWIIFLILSSLNSPCDRGDLSGQCIYFVQMALDCVDGTAAAFPRACSHCLSRMRAKESPKSRFNARLGQSWEALLNYVWWYRGRKEHFFFLNKILCIYDLGFTKQVSWVRHKDKVRNKYWNQSPLKCKSLSSQSTW